MSTLQGQAPPSTLAGPSPTPPAVAATRRLENFDARRVDPRATAKVRDAGWPVNREGSISARGYLFTADGRQLNSKPLRPRSPSKAPAREDLKEPWSTGETMTTTWHVEGDVAAKIRADGLNGAAFYLNVDLCGKPASGTERPDPKGCNENFQHIIPANVVVYVHVVPERGLPYRRRVTGTGEGIKDD